MSRVRQPDTDRPVLLGPPSGAAARIGEEHAARVLERAAALDARRSSEFEVDQLRDAAAAAGISPEAFDEAMAEIAGGGPGAEGARARAAAPVPTREAREIGTADFAHYSELLRDLLGEDGSVTVADGRIEWSDDGMRVSITPSPRGATAAITTEGSYRRRALAIFLATLPVLFVSIMVAIAEDEEAGLVVAGILMGLFTALFGTFVSQRREGKQMRKKAERIRRQLQRMLAPGTPEG